MVACPRRSEQHSSFESCTSTLRFRFFLWIWFHGTVCVCARLQVERAGKMEKKSQPPQNKTIETTTACHGEPHNPTTLCCGALQSILQTCARTQHCARGNEWVVITFELPEPVPSGRASGISTRPDRRAPAQATSLALWPAAHHLPDKAGGWEERNNNTPISC